jgi:hypothetical protein
MLTRRPVLIGSIVCLASFLSFVAINAQGGTGGGIIGSSDLPLTASIDAAQSAAFGVLRRPQEVGDALNPTSGAPFGANLQLARAVRADEGIVRIVPGNGSTCLRAEDPVGSAWTCGPDDVVTKSALMLSLRDPSGETPVILFGLVPDSVTAAVLNTAGGSKQQLTISQNVFSARAFGPTSVTFSDSTGQTNFDVP